MMGTLYNLGAMSCRELAALKALGFRDKQIGRLLIGQNIWLTVVGRSHRTPRGVWGTVVSMRRADLRVWAGNHRQSDNLCHQPAAYLRGREPARTGDLIGVEALKSTE